MPPTMPVTSTPPPTTAVIPPIMIPLSFPLLLTLMIWGARTPAAAPSSPKPAMARTIQLSPQLPTNHLNMHKIAIPAAITAVLLVLPAGRLAKIGDGREVSNNRTAGVEPPLQCVESSRSLILLLELDVDISDHVVGEVVADVEALDFAEFAELLEDVLVEILEMLLDLGGVDRLALGVDAGSDHVGALVHVGQEQRRRDGGAVVEAGAPVAVAACADFEVEGAVDAVFLGAENGGQVLRHCLWIEEADKWNWRKNLGR